jgi:hypothetical protein
MRTYAFGRAVLLATLVLGAAGCAATAGPWKAHDLTHDLKRNASDPTARCPVVFSNDTGALIEAGYLSEGVESSVGMIPSGHSLEVAVSCRNERIEAFAVADQGLVGGTAMYRKAARLNLARVTHLDITAADRVR